MKVLASFFRKCGVAVAALFRKYREIILYLIFGVLTTVISFAVYFVILHAAGVEDGDQSLFANVIRVVAEILQWVAGVLFAFFTNKKWVFEDKSGKPTWKLLAVFAGSRLTTLGLDAAVTLGLANLLIFGGYVTRVWDNPIYPVEFSADAIAKLVAAVLVVIGNYVLSKLVVFRKNKQEPPPKKESDS